jgi:hypothetical protein
VGAVDVGRPGGETGGLASDVAVGSKADPVVVVAGPEPPPPPAHAVTSIPTRATRVAHQLWWFRGVNLDSDRAVPDRDGAFDDRVSAQALPIKSV